MNEERLLSAAREALKLAVCIALMLGMAAIGAVSLEDEERLSGVHIGTADIWTTFGIFCLPLIPALVLFCFRPLKYVSTATIACLLVYVACITPNPPYYDNPGGCEECMGPLLLSMLSPFAIPTVSAVAWAVLALCKNIAGRLAVETAARGQVGIEDHRRG